MTVVLLAGDLTQAQLALEQAHFPVRQAIGEGAALDTNALFSKAPGPDAAHPALAMGQRVKARLFTVIDQHDAIRLFA